MPQFNVQMLTNMLASALTATVTAWLSYLAAWSHFSTSENTALATIIAAGLSIMLGQLLTIFINRWTTLINRVAQMPGVEKITVNANANTTLATLAVDSAQPKIEATPQATRAVQETAAAAS